MLFRPGDYDPQYRLTAPARPTSALWRLVVGVGVMSVAYIALMLLSAGVVVTLAGDAGRVVLRALMVGETPFGLTALLYTFVFLAGGLAVALRVLHRRDLADVIGPWPVALHDFRRVALALIALSLAFLVLMPLSPEVTRNTSLAQQVPWLPLALLGLLIQTGTEELVFRGYLQSQLSARFRSPLVWIGLPSLLFGLVHYNPEAYGPNAWAVVAWATVFGVLAADLTARTGSLGAAMGLHFATNFGAMFLVGAAGNLDGLALYTLEVDLRDPALITSLLTVDLAALVISWLLARVVLRK